MPQGIRQKSQVRRLQQKAQRYFVGGVNSPVRSFRYIGGDPLLIEKGKGPFVWDYEGRRYCDFVLSWGAAILGHAHPFVVDRVQQAIEKGAGFGTTHANETELADLLVKAVPFVEKIRFVTSGTEAVMGALRLARGITGRDKILKFGSAYHGHADYLLAQAGSGLASLRIPLSSGVPKDFIKHTLVASYGDAQAVDKFFEKNGSEIAAVIVEPVGANAGVVPPDRQFLKRLKVLAGHYGALLVFDEVVTGFRFHFGSFAELAGVEPDLIVFGKIIGGGLPIGAYGGKNKWMRHLAPEGEVYQASTFAGNPIVMAAGAAVLRTLELSHKAYANARQWTGMLARGLQEAANAAGVFLKVNQFDSMFSLKFRHKKEFIFFYRRLLREGVFLAPSEYESNFLSFAHSAEEVKKTINVATRIFKRFK